MSIVFHEGHDFAGPDGQGYVLTMDVREYDPITAGHFSAYGGAPEPFAGKKLPDWLVRQIWPDGLYEKLN